MFLSARLKTRFLRHTIVLAALAHFMADAHAQHVDKRLCREFSEAGTLYVLSDGNDQRTFPNMEGQPRTYPQLVQEVWPEKNIVVMDKDRFEAQENVRDLFFVSEIRFSVYSGPSLLYSFSTIILKKGKVKNDPYKTLYASYLEDNVYDGVAASRFLTGLQEMRAQTDHPEEGDRGSGSYRTSDLGSKLHADTLYVRNTDVWIKSLNGATPEEKDLRDVYPFPLRLVSPEQWAQVLDQRREGVAYVEIIRGGSGAVVTIHNASDGRLLLSTMRLFINKKFFADLAEG
jgi:hypothetical protein